MTQCEAHYVLVNTKTNKPFKGFDVMNSLDRVRWFLYEGIYTEEEIDELTEELENKGKAEIDSLFDMSIIKIKK